MCGESFGIMTFDLDLGENHKWANIALTVDLRQFEQETRPYWKNKNQWTTKALWPFYLKVFDK